MADGITALLQRLDLGRYADLFAENDIDLAALPHITEDDLRELGLTLGARRKLLAAIETLSQAPPPGPQAAGAAAEPSAAAERRLLTVLFCDLVGSTALSSRLDPEDMRDLLTRYQDVVADVVGRHEGYVANYLGDGVLAYFGWPHAHEDQALQAVRAGLAAVAAVGRLTVPAGGEALSARVGVDTGMVVVGDLVGRSASQKDAVSGETPNVAARLQALASPGAVLIGTGTRQLLGGTFDLDSLGGQAIRGMAEPVPAWRVRGERRAESRFEAASGRRLTRFVGRNNELGLLLDRWAMAREGEGQIVLISGEAGIGKSRLMLSLRDSVAAEPHRRLRYQCSPYHTSSALYPVVQQLERAAGLAAGDDEGAKVDKLEMLLRQAEEDIATAYPVFARLLGLPVEAGHEVAGLSPQELKQRTLEALTAQLLALGEREPVLFLFEDAHWADPTSQELLALAAARLERARVLMVITHRPEWQPPFPHLANLTPLRLNRLARRQGAEIVRALAGGHVADEIVERIVTRTDGVPLFIEELTKAMVERGLDLAEADIPATLQSSLLARLDRLGPAAREVAQIGAVIGREFTRDLVGAAAGRPEAELADAFDRLVQSELVYRSGSPARPTYTFKHALVQEVAYGSLLRNRRQGLHLAVAQQLRTADAAGMEASPELLARHFEGGGAADEAIAHWARAGDEALARGAQSEAAAAFASAVRLLDNLESKAEREGEKLGLLLRLGQAEFGAFGGAAERTAATFGRAAVLAERLGAVEDLFRARYGVWVGRLIAGRLAEALALAEEVGRSAESAAGHWTKLLAARMSASPNYLSGRLHEALAQLQQIVQARADLEAIALGFAHHPYFTALATLPHVEWGLGRPDTARRGSEETIDEVAAARLEPNTISYALTWDLLLRLLCRHQESAMSRATQLLDYTERSGGAFWKQIAIIGQGGASILGGKPSRGIELLRTGTMRLMDTGLMQHVPFFKVLEAEGLLAMNEPRSGLAALDEGHRILESTNQRFYLPELLRVRAGTLESLGRTDEAEQLLDEAIAVAREQGSRSWELRSLNGMVRLRRMHGTADDGAGALRRAYDAFSEGFDLPDLQEARSLLDGVGRA